jgi:hydroxymethylpyrimidine pyrophosphatase-like HAD family hydrolase
MLKRAGVSVAMGNGVQSVRQAAMHVVGSNADDGWADAMDRFVLGVAVG